MPVGLAQNWTDARDSKVYRIKKMLDNKCWMIDNLGYLGDGTNTYGDVVPTGSTNATLNILTSGAGQTGTTDINDWNQGHQRMRALDNTNPSVTVGNGTRCDYSTVTGTSPMNSACGSVLYNWCAAVKLNDNTTPTCDAVNATTTGTNMSSPGVVSTSICPANWHLPIGRIGFSDHTLNEFAILNASMNSNTYNSTPNTSTGASFYENWYPTGSFSGLGSGYFYPSSGLGDQSTSGPYWSSSLYSTNLAAGMGMTSGYVTSGTTNNNKLNGLAVRCVLN
jgi:uncharacterized protein (TIGR02145 family)